MPRTVAGARRALRPVGDQQRLALDERGDRRDARVARARVARIAGQSASPRRTPLSVACEVMLRMRLRSSRSNPFITDSTTISTATPIATPTIDISEMNDRKRLPRRAQVAPADR